MGELSCNAGRRRIASTQMNEQRTKKKGLGIGPGEEQRRRMDFCPHQQKCSFSFRLEVFPLCSLLFKGIKETKTIPAQEKSEKKNATNWRSFFLEIKHVRVNRRLSASNIISAALDGTLRWRRRRCMGKNAPWCGGGRRDRRILG